MQLENEFTVPASIEQAWAVLLDIPRVAPCLPGATVDDGTDMRVTGPAAQFGRGVMQDVSAKLMTRFAECLAEQMQASPDVETTDGAAAPAAAEVETAAPTAESPAAAG